MYSLPLVNRLCNLFYLGSVIRRIGWYQFLFHKINIFRLFRCNVTFYATKRCLVKQELVYFVTTLNIFQFLTKFVKFVKGKCLKIFLCLVHPCVRLLKSSILALYWWTSAWKDYKYRNEQWDIILNRNNMYHVDKNR